jgi:hypothetical protein
MNIVSPFDALSKGKLPKFPAPVATCRAEGFDYRNALVPDGATDKHIFQKWKTKRIRWRRRGVPIFQAARISSALATTVWRERTRPVETSGLRCNRQQRRIDLGQ